MIETEGGSKINADTDDRCRFYQSLSDKFCFCAKPFDAGSEQDWNEQGRVD